MRVHVWYDEGYPCPLEKDIEISIPQNTAISVEGIVDAAGKELARTIAEACKSKNEWKKTRLRMYCVAVYVEPDKRKIIWNTYPLGVETWKWLALPHPSWWWYTDSEIKAQQEAEQRMKANQDM